jgi:hypothetical protein
VHAAPNAANPIAYTATTNGNAGANSTLIRCSFAAEVAGLVVGDITVADDTGSVTTGALTGSGTSWALAITVNTVGNVKVSIDKTGITDAEKTVEVFSVIGYTAVADGSVGSASTAIAFSFDESVDSLNLTANDISVTNGTGTAVKGALTGNGVDRSLEIGVTRAGTVSVRINKAGIESATKTVTVYAIGYTATADGNADTTSTKIDFVFTTAVAGLTADSISITNGTGSAVKGNLSGNGTEWSLEITGVGVTGLGATSGTVRVRINKAGIEDVEKELTVFKALDYTDEVEIGYTNDNSSGLNMETPESKGSGITTITMDATEAGEPSFIITKTAGQFIDAGGTDSDMVTVYTDGTVIDGTTSSATLAVVVVKAGMLPFTGGTPDFYLTVSEPGKLNRIVDVSMKIKTLKTGAAVFKVIRPAGQTYANGDDNVILERVGGDLNNLAAALLWVENNAEANTEYIVRVENDEINLSLYRFAFNNAENVTLRLMGSKKEEDGDVWTRTLKHSGTTTAVNVKNLGNYNAFIQIGTAGTGPKKTLILDRNITLEGIGGSSQSTRYRCLIYVGQNVNLVLRPGAVITKHVRTTKSNGGSVIEVISADLNPNRDPELNGRVRLEGGSITDCKLDNVIPEPNLLSQTASYLISFRHMEDRYALGSFYKAAGVVLSGNVNFQDEDINEVVFGANYDDSHGFRHRYSLINAEKDEINLPVE